MLEAGGTLRWSCQKIKIQIILLSPLMYKHFSTLQAVSPLFSSYCFVTCKPF